MIDDPSHPDDADRPEADDLPDEEISRYADSEMPTLDPSSVPNSGEGGTVERKSIADRAKVPDRIGPYRVLSVIGFGGMGRSAERQPSKHTQNPNPSRHNQTLVRKSAKSKRARAGSTTLTSRQIEFERKITVNKTLISLRF